MTLYDSDGLPLIDIPHQDGGTFLRHIAELNAMLTELNLVLEDIAWITESYEMPNAVKGYLINRTIQRVNTTISNVLEGRIKPPKVHKV